MKKSIAFKLISCIIAISMLSSLLAISASATEDIASKSKCYSIEVDGVIYAVYINDNADGTKAIGMSQSCLGRPTSPRR